MQNTKRYRDRLKRILLAMPPNSANIPTVLHRIDELYIKMLEEENSKHTPSFTARKRKPQA